jgi:predicted nuclease of restriction endonuclease-like RecB superfamily
MALQRGGGKVFPSELMIVRKLKSGLVFPVFLSDDSNDYISSVKSVFESNTGKNKETILKALKELEVNSSSVKTIRALSLLFFRNSILEPPVNVDAPALRLDVFKAAKIPPVNNNEKESILKPLEEKYGLTMDEIIAGLYSDKESELVLRQVYSATPIEIARAYNLEQLETIMLRCTVLYIKESSDWSYTITSIKRLGLLYTADVNGENLEDIKITGPLEMFESPERYGSRFAQLIYKISMLEKWVIEADIKIKDKFEKTVKVYKLKLSDAISYYLPESKKSESTGYDYVTRAGPLIIDGNAYFPDYKMKIYDKDVYINITGKTYAKRDNEIKKNLLGKVIWENVYIARQADKKIKEAIVFNGDIDFPALKSMLEEKYSGKKALNNELDKASIESLKKEVDRLYPKTEKMFEYLESQGMIPERVLPAMGYKLKWHGLDITVIKKD